ncbi:MAG TPA: redox-sensing transcriptional repressor Rex, partial [Acidimicrobiales bacterium]
ARGFRIVALFDADPHRIGEVIDGIVVHPLEELPLVAAATPIAIGILAVPAPVAQQVADRLVEAGVLSILNFAPTVITVPDRVSLRKVDLSIELQILSFYSQRLVGDGAREATA